MDFSRFGRASPLLVLCPSAVLESAVSSLFEGSLNEAPDGSGVFHQQVIDTIGITAANYFPSRHAAYPSLAGD